MENTPNRHAKLTQPNPEIWQTELPKIEGLLLTGGRSERMGEDKAWLEYHGKPQWQVARELLERLGIATRISCREEQAARFPADTQLLFDTFLGLGPMGGLLSAFRENPNSAWLVLACDLPFLTEKSIEKLLASRNPLALATALHSADEPPLPEPLIAIWEPRAYPKLLQWLSEGSSCLRKFLRVNDSQLVAPPVLREILNINSPDERADFFTEKFLKK